MISLSYTVLISVCTRGAYRSRYVTVDVPPETWEGEGALMTCTFTLRDHFDDYLRVLWFKGNGRKVVFYYRRYHSTSRAFNDLLDRCEGKLEGNVHKLYINSTIVTDEDTYMCRVDTASDQKILTVYGEYSVY